MSRLNWQKARHSHKAWAYSRSAPITSAPQRPRPTRSDWQRSKLKRRIDALTARIASGRQWLLTIPSTDQKHALWSRKINELRAERTRLKSLLK